MPPSSNPAQFRAPREHTALPELGRGAASYGWFITGVATWFTAMGMQSVLFSWLVVGVLHAKAEWVGIAQSAMMRPSVLFILLGGAVADRHDRRTLLIVLHLVATLLSASLVAAGASGRLRIPVHRGGAGRIEGFCPGLCQAEEVVWIERSEIRAATGQRKETEPAPPLSVSRLYLSPQFCRLG